MDTKINHDYFRVIYSGVGESFYCSAYSSINELLAEINDAKKHGFKAEVKYYPLTSESPVGVSLQRLTEFANSNPITAVRKLGAYNG